MKYKCSCCGKEHESVEHYKLPEIGYGSLFDTIGGTEPTVFNVCPECKHKMNNWLIRKLPPDVTLEKFWKCETELHTEITSTGIKIGYFEFEFESILADLFVKFMPEEFFGPHYFLEKIKYYLDKLIR